MRKFGWCIEQLQYFPANTYVDPGEAALLVKAEELFLTNVRLTQFHHFAVKSALLRKVLTKVL